MSKNKKWLIVAISLILVGCITFTFVMARLDWDFLKLGTSKYRTQTYDITETFSDISIENNTADILFVLANDGKCRVVCYDNEKIEYQTGVSNGKLNIKPIDNRKWFEHIGINFESSRITVYLPERELGNLFVKNDTGDIKLYGLSLNSIDLKVSTGDIELKNVIAKEAFSFKTSTGDIEFEACDANNIFIKTDTGDVEGSLLSSKVFIAKTDTGSIEVPKTTTGGKCEIITDTGDIEIDIKE